MKLHKTFLVLLLLLGSALSLAQEKRFALVIGNEDYKNATPLQNPVNDAKAISVSLKDLGFEILYYANLDQKGMKQAIDLFGEKLKDYRVGIFYYSGHGIQVNGNNYLIPVDANLGSENDAEYDCVDAGRVLAKMEASGTKTNIIILDACRNNPFERSWTRSYAKNGLAFMDAPVGSLIAYSTSPGSTASDGSGKNGLYTTFLLNSMINPDLNILQVFQEVRKNVREDSNGNQVPWESTSLEDDFYFNQTGKLLTVSAPLSDEKNVKTDVRELLGKMDAIKADTSLLWFEAEDETLAAADQKADEELNKMLYEYLLSKLKGKKQIAEISKQHAEGIALLIDEFRNISLRKVLETRKKTTVVRYISKHEIDLNLELKKNKIEALIDGAAEAEKELRIADALKYYYWAYTLAMVYPNSAFTDSTSGLLKDKITGVINSVQFHAVDSTVSDNSKLFNLAFNSGGLIVQNINFQYWNGVAWSDITYSNNGTGAIEVYPSYSIKDIKIKLEYANIPESGYDPYLNKSLQLTLTDQFSAERKLSVKAESYKTESVINAGVQKIINQLLVKVKNRDVRYDTTLFTEQGFDIYKKLLVYGNAKIYGNENSYSGIYFGQNTYVRGVPCTFTFENNSVKFTENLCFELNSRGKLENITFTLSEKASKDVMSQERWPIESRLQIILFLENYKTAYALKRYDYIEKIFSDKALIIVGQRVEESEKIDGAKYALTGENYEFTRLTKEQYLYRLRKVFNQNKFINIRFEENIVKKRDNQSDVYGINIRQNYFSSNYSDQGYLFLMVDMKDSLKPMIYVRSWQPLQSFNGHPINLSDFTN